MAIRFSCNNIEFHLGDEHKLRNWITEVVELTGKMVGNISYLFCDDNYLLGVNQKYLNHDTFTDIITFDYVAGGLISGDIMISVERIKENAETFNVPFDDELHRVIIHGVLHLLGQGDKTCHEADRMRMLEENALDLWKRIEL